MATGFNPFKTEQQFDANSSARLQSALAGANKSDELLGQHGIGQALERLRGKNVLANTDLSNRGAISNTLANNLNLNLDPSKLFGTAATEQVTKGRQLENFIKSIDAISRGNQAGILFPEKTGIGGPVTLGDLTNEDVPLGFSLPPAAVSALTRDVPDVTRTEAVETRREIDPRTGKPHPGSRKITERVSGKDRELMGKIVDLLGNRNQGRPVLNPTKLDPEAVAKARNLQRQINAQGYTIIGQGVDKNGNPTLIIKKPGEKAREMSLMPKAPSPADSTNPVDHF